MSPEHTPFSCIMHLPILGSMLYLIPKASNQHSILYITPHLYPSIIPICFMPLYAKHSPVPHCQCRRFFDDAWNRNFSKTEWGRITSRASFMKSLSASKDSIFSPPNPKAFLTRLISMGVRDRMAALFNLFAFSIPSSTFLK